jgi:hypothetical protein
MPSHSSYASDHAGLAALVRLYAIAGDKRNDEGVAQQEKVAGALRDAKWQLTKHIGKRAGTFPGIEWYELLGEYVKAMKRLVEAGDKDFPDIYKKCLNTLLANKDKRLQFVRERLKPTPEELKTLDDLLMSDIVNTGAYIRHRDGGLMDEELWYWENVRAANSQIGSIMETLIKRRRDEDESDTSDGEPAKDRDGTDRRRRPKSDGGRLRRTVGQRNHNGPPAVQHTR